MHLVLCHVVSWFCSGLCCVALRCVASGGGGPEGPHPGGLRQEEQRERRLPHAVRGPGYHPRNGDRPPLAAAPADRGDREAGVCVYACVCARVRVCFVFGCFRARVLVAVVAANDVLVYWYADVRSRRGGVWKTVLCSFGCFRGRFSFLVMSTPI